MKLTFIICALFFASCARQTFIPAGVLIRAGDAKIEKCALCDTEAFIIHFPKEVYFKDFDGAIPGVLGVSQNNKYSIVVRVGLGFDQVKVLKKVAKSAEK